MAYFPHIQENTNVTTFTTTDSSYTGVLSGLITLPQDSQVVMFANFALRSDTALAPAAFTLSIGNETRPDLRTYLDYADRYSPVAINFYSTSLSAGNYWVSLNASSSDNSSEILLSGVSLSAFGITNSDGDTLQSRLITEALNSSIDFGGDDFNTCGGYGDITITQDSRTFVDLSLHYASRRNPSEPNHDKIGTSLSVGSNYTAVYHESPNITDGMYIVGGNSQFSNEIVSSPSSNANARVNLDGSPDHAVSGIDAYLIALADYDDAGNNYIMSGTTFSTPNQDSSTTTWHEKTNYAYSFNVTEENTRAFISATVEGQVVTSSTLYDSYYRVLLDGEPLWETAVEREEFGDQQYINLKGFTDILSLGEHDVTYEVKAPQETGRTLRTDQFSSYAFPLPTIAAEVEPITYSGLHTTDAYLNKVFTQNSYTDTFLKAEIAKSYTSDSALGTTRSGENQTTILRPESDDTIACSPVGASPNFQCVNEVNANDDTDYVQAGTFASVDISRIDIYGLSDSGISDDNLVISNVRLYHRSGYTGSSSIASVRGALVIDGTVYQGNSDNVSSSYTQYSDDWSTNPDTGSAWTWADVDALKSQLTIRAKDTGPGLNVKCTQTYVEITYHEVSFVDEKYTSFTSDAVLYSEVAKNHTSDAVLAKENLNTHTVDAILSDTKDSEYISDAILLKVGEASNTSDALLFNSGGTSYTSDSALCKENNVSITTDAILLDGINQTYTTDALLLSTIATASISDALLFDSKNISHTNDALLFIEKITDYTTDSYLALNNAVSHTTDSYLLKSTDISYSSDSILRGEKSAEYTTDAELSFATSVDYISDCALSVERSTENLTDCFTVYRESPEHNTDALLYGTKSHWDIYEYILSPDGLPYVGVVGRAVIVDSQNTDIRPQYATSDSEGKITWVLPEGCKVHITLKEAGLKITKTVPSIGIGSARLLDLS